MSTIPEEFSCIAVDMGAGSIRVMLGTIDGMGISYEEVHRISNKIIHIDGHDRWDSENIIEGIWKGIRKAMDLATITPNSIGVDSWGADVVLLDKNGELVESPIAYRDNRTEGMIEKWNGM